MSWIMICLTFSKIFPTENLFPFYKFGYPLLPFFSKEGVSFSFFLMIRAKYHAQQMSINQKYNVNFPLSIARIY